MQDMNKPVVNEVWRDIGLPFGDSLSELKRGSEEPPLWVRQMEEAGFLRIEEETRASVIYTPLDELQADMTKHGVGFKILVCREYVSDVEVTGVLMSDKTTAKVEYDVFHDPEPSKYLLKAPALLEGGMMRPGRCPRGKKKGKPRTYRKYDDGWR